MAHDEILIPPVVQHVQEQAVLDAGQLAHHRLATSEEVQAADRLFAKQEQEHQFVEGLLGLYASTILFRDLAAEHLARDPREEQEEELRKWKESAPDADQ